MTGRGSAISAWAVRAEIIREVHRRVRARYGRGGGPRSRCHTERGNYYRRHMHAEGWLKPGGGVELEWHIDPADVTPNELGFRYSGRDRFEVALDIRRAAIRRGAGSLDVDHGGRPRGGSRLPP